MAAQPLHRAMPTSGHYAIFVTAFLTQLAFVLQGCGGGGGGSGGGGGGGGGGNPPTVDLVKEGLRSVSYAPMYLQDQTCVGTFAPHCATGFLTDDFTAHWSQPIWGGDTGSTLGRGDMHLISSMGANAVRLYGNDVRFNKKDFLDTLRSNGLQVIVGISSYWYNEAGGPLCAGPKSQADCHDTIKDAYAKNLQGGFLEDGYYHNAIGVVNVMNEPDFLGSELYLKAMVTAFDGILSAEKDAGVKKWNDGTLPRLTITWSFALAAGGTVTCDEKHFIKDPATECGPGLTFMVQFLRVVQDPQGTVGYTPKNDLVTAYKERWLNAFNTFVDSSQVDIQFMQKYMKLSMFDGIHAFCGEWHPKPEKPPAELTKELQRMTSFKDQTNTSLFMGASFFQFQTAYNKEGTEREFGMFNLGSDIVGFTNYIEGDSAQNHPINCLKKTATVDCITNAWSGSGVSGSPGLCVDATAPVDVVV